MIIYLFRPQVKVLSNSHKSEWINWSNSIFLTIVLAWLQVSHFSKSFDSLGINYYWFSLLGSKILQTKCIRTSMYNVLANYDQNLESRFRLLKVCSCVKLESSDCRIYWTKSARLDWSKIRLDRLNLMQIVFSIEFPTQPKPIRRVGFYVLLQV